MKLIRRSDWARLTPTEFVLGLWVRAMDSGGCSVSGVLVSKLSCGENRPGVGSGGDGGSRRCCGMIERQQR